MALQTSGQISMDDMRVEAGATGQVDLATLGSTFGVSYTTNGGNDLQFSEFYGQSGTIGSSFPYNTNSWQSDTIGENVTTYWTHAESLPFTLSSYTVWMKVNSGSWSIRQSGLSASLDQWTDISTQPGFDIYTRVQAIGTGGEKSPSDADMILGGTTYPPTALTTTEDLTPTTY